VGLKIVVGFCGVCGLVWACMNLPNCVGLQIGLVLQISVGLCVLAV
jgi:hypothetical protein